MVSAKKERRREQRVKAELPIKISCGQSEIITSTKNISNLGTRVELKREIPLNSHVKIVLTIPAFARMKIFSKQIECEGTIIRCEFLKERNALDGNYSIGIFFTDFSHEDNKRLAGYLDRFVSREERRRKKWVKKWKSRK